MANKAPVITIKQLTYDSGTGSYSIDTSVSDHNKWAPGVVKAGQSSGILNVAVFNNFANKEDLVSPIADMIECSVTALDSNGAKLEPIYTESWIKVNVNGDQTDDSDPVDQWTAIGAIGDQAIWNNAATPTFVPVPPEDVDKVSYHRQVNTPTDEAVIKSTVTTKDVDATLADRAKYALCRFRIDPPASADPGSKGFKIRFQGYYV